MRSAIPGACGSGDGFILPFTPGGDCIPCWISMPEFVCFAHKKQVSTHQFTQFHKVTKISIAISASFVYNVTIRVPAPQMEGFPSRKEY